ncbi:glycosyltransferase family 39 protein [Aquimarina sp. MMG016]|uniref:ArnT family glycosyltransferase n=1 Tax=Aquimarina sp. MMG016 TaxID=2822690 RepID=UPI001B3A0F0F|nr:glycosyltransferase family 39 protein [Aquimarina sp. MMG016]MBQ4821773.1 glycosyltransferase family 39 protein [Aquimarina sp. MMG016]
MKILYLITHKYSPYLGIPLIFLLVLKFIGFDGLYGQDSYEYLRYSKAIQIYLEGGQHPGSFYWPVLYPFLGSLFGYVFGNIAFGLHFLTVISFSISLIYLYKTIQLLYPEKSSSVFYYVLIFGLFSPYFLKSGLVVMSDILASMFVMLTYYYFFKSYQKKNSFASVFIFATCALMTRYATLVITLPVILYITYLVIKRQNFTDIFIGVFFSILICIPFIILQNDNLYEGTSNYFLNSWSFATYFSSSYETVDGLQTYRFPNLIFVLYILTHPGFIFIGILLIVFTLKTSINGFSHLQKVVLIPIIMYLAFLAGIPFQNIRILGLLFPLVLLFFYPAFIELTSIKLITQYKQVLGRTCIIIQLLMWSYTFNNVFKRTLFEKQLANSMSFYQGNTLYGFDFDVSLQGRGLDFKYQNMYNDLYVDYKENELVLFNPTLFTKQWEGENPMKNWEYIKQFYNLKTLENFDNGWSLYQIKEKE